MCSQCHLHATVDVLRQGEDAFSYRPGRPLSAHEALFAVPGLDEGGEGIAVVSHAARMQASACYRGSISTAAPLECVTCHDPHRGFEARPAGARSAACVTCHADGRAEAVPADLRAEHAATTGCVSCHMPRVEADDAPHSAFTDHWIRVVRGPVRAVEPEVGRTGAVAPLDATDREGDVGALYEGMAAVTLGVRQQSQDPVASGAQFIRIALDRLDSEAWPDARFLLGVALLQAGRAEEAVGPLRAAAEAATPSTRPQRLETLARALADAGRANEAVSAFAQAVAAQPRRPETRREYGRLLLTTGRLDRAEPQLGVATDKDPWDPEAHLLLGLVDAAAGRDPTAEWREAVRLDPELAAVVSSGVRVEAGGVEPLWTAPTVFGWPASAPLDPGAPVVVYSTSGGLIGRGAWGDVARRLGSGVVVVSTGGDVRRVAVVRYPGTT